MMKNDDLPIGFTMELAIRSDKLDQFAQLPREQKERIVDGARQVNSKEEMRNYVETMIK